MMNRVLHPTVFRHLQSVQASDHVGLHSFLRQSPSCSRSSRTVYRWQRSLGDQLLVVPNVAVEALGLRHVHIFVIRPDPSWLALPYAIEASWITRDFVGEELYIHCLVPDGVSLEAVVCPCERYTVVVSGSGWQQFLDDETEIVLPIPTHPPVSPVLRRCPFVIPATMELWQYPNSLPLAWARIHHRLGNRVKAFLPRTRVHYVNGKTHLTSAFRLLRDEQLVRQHIVRYHPLLAMSVEVFLTVRMDRDSLTHLLHGLRTHLHAVETYPTKDGYWCRLLGPHRLLDAIINLPLAVRERCAAVHFHTKRHPAPVVRFAYETVFDPVTGWVSR